MVLFKYKTKYFYDYDFKVFTFHYGPIQMPNDEYENDYIALFTFHYGPIQINDTINI